MLKESLCFKALCRSLVFSDTWELLVRVSLTGVAIELMGFKAQNSWDMTDGLMFYSSYKLVLDSDLFTMALTTTGYPIIFNIDNKWPKSTHIFYGKPG